MRQLTGFQENERLIGMAPMLLQNQHDRNNARNTFER
jgi:hypothetical protein